MSFHFNDRRHLVLAVQNGLTGHIDAQPEYEIARRRRQPVGFMACRSGILDMNVDRPVGIRNEAGAIAHAISVDRIHHKVIFCITHRQRPECIIRRELACLKVHDVVVLAGELLTRAIYFRRPIHRLLWQVYWTKKCFGARGSEQDAMAGLAASENGGPAVDLRDIGTRENLKCDERQHSPNDDPLHDIRENGSIEHEDSDDGSPEHDGEHPFASISSVHITVCVIVPEGVRPERSLTVALPDRAWRPVSKDRVHVEDIVPAGYPA